MNDNILILHPRQSVGKSRSMFFSAWDYCRNVPFSKCLFLTSTPIAHYRDILQCLKKDMVTYTVESADELRIEFNNDSILVITNPLNGEEIQKVLPDGYELTYSEEAEFTRQDYKRLMNKTRERRNKKKGGCGCK